MNFKDQTTIIIILSGLGLSSLHFLLSYFFLIYFGLGMDPKGAEFTVNIFLQPGTIIEETFKASNPFVTNGFFYFFIGVAIAYAIFKRRNV